jgi:hypothetical protein
MFAHNLNNTSHTAIDSSVYYTDQLRELVYIVNFKLWKSLLFRLGFDVLQFYANDNIRSSFFLYHF